MWADMDEDARVLVYERKGGMMYELKVCPFCGSDNVFSDPRGSLWRIGCHECLAQSSGHETRQDCVDAWNELPGRDKAAGNEILTDASEIVSGYYWLVELDDNSVEEPVQVYAGGDVYEIGIEYSLGDVQSYIKRGYGFVRIEPPEIVREKNKKT